MALERAKGHLRRLAFASALFASASAWAVPTTVNVKLEESGDAVVIEASALLRADAATAWRVLTEYDHYSDFIPGVRSSRVVKRQGTRVTVEQTGDAAVWLLQVPLDITYEITEFPPNRIQSQASGSSLSTLTSSYALTPTAQGVRLDYAGYLSPRRALLGKIEEMAVRRSVVREFQALADEIERRDGFPTRATQ